ncbi:MAG: 2-oxoacid:acceptor oxidoreductase family protein, partial [Syntrophales bacterium LBB04]|nr:2-oxoacid:acceptor oxidoreductase family protein [Syntrophales bacterium LBB04]
VITNTRTLLPFTVAIGQGIYPPVDEVLDKIHTKVGNVIALEGNELAEEAGNPLSLNMVMLGALIGADVTPVTVDAMKKIIAANTKKSFIDSNLKAFHLGMEVAKKLMSTKKP